MHLDYAPDKRRLFPVGGGGERGKVSPWAIGNMGFD